MNQIWNLAAQDMNGYAWFIKKNMNALHIDGTLTNPSLIQVMDGSLAVPQLKADTDVPIPIAIGTDFVQISWENDPHIKKARLSDSLMYMTYRNHIFSEIMDTGYTRNQKFCIVPKSQADAQTSLCYLYFFFKNDHDTLFTPNVNVTVNPD